MKSRFKSFYMDICKRTAQMSRAERLKVGAIVVKNGNIIAFGYNGTPTGWNNKCEKEKIALCYNNFGPECKTLLETVPEVIHAEANCIYKLAKSNESGIGASMFCSHSPCLECSKAIYMSGIAEVFYREEYRSKNGISFLEKVGVAVEKLT